MALFDALYALVILLAALLLFLVEPMSAKRLLPILGGSSAVWIACLVFFQTALLAGYLYSHLVVTRLTARAQALTHSVLLVLATIGLGVLFQPGSAGASWHPLATTLWLLTAMIGLPFVALSATTPLLQSWQSRSGSQSQKSPAWRLYALSNLGSLLALVLYPWLVEPRFALAAQRLAWGTGFAVFAVACAGVTWMSARIPERVGSASGEDRESASDRESARVDSKAAKPLPIPRRLLWLLLPAASSMLLCAITAHLGQNIAAIPLLWVVPLAAYLLSFVVTFAGQRWYRRTLGLRFLALALATIGYLLQDRNHTQPLLISLPIYVGSLFLFCYFCHGELYRLRPAAGQSTSFYLVLSLGSAIGAIFIGVAAPFLFRANCDLVASLVFLALLALAATWELGVPARGFWFAATAAMVWVAMLNVRSLNQHTISQLRSFYGSLRVTETFAIPGPGIERTLFHGTIQHGIQIFNDKLRARPTSYYAADSGVGLALRFCCRNGPRRVGVVGLGAGTIAAYAEPGDEFTFYEIDPLVERLARARFTYLRESRAPVNVVMGDARVSLEHEQPRNYDVLVLDAFSGDAIPVHLLTEQAIELYRRHLNPNGVLAFHISSQYVDLAPVLAAQAHHAGMIALGVHSLANDELGEFQSDWVLMSADADFFRQPEVAIASHPLAVRPELPLWTDDLNSLLPLIKWTGFETPEGPAPPPAGKGK